MGREMYERDWRMSKGVEVLYAWMGLVGEWQGYSEKYDCDYGWSLWDCE
jgi:hypothetical protein